MPVKSGGVTDLADASVVHPKNPSANLGIDRKYLLVLFVLHLNLIKKSVGCSLLSTTYIDQ